MINNEPARNPNFYLAPMQGFTDYVYRKVFAQVFGAIDAYFIPYISVKNGEVLKKHKTELLPENNLQERVVPQVLVSSAEEIIFLARFLEELGYREVNLNLGCPYPMATNKGMGAGLLPFPEKISEILTAFYAESHLKLSVKMRSGFNSFSEIEKVIPVLNGFPLSEVILHPRVAKQMYEDTTDERSVDFALKNLQHRLVYNGDIHSKNNYDQFTLKFPEIHYFMLGRGVLMNPFLAETIKNGEPDEKSKWNKLQLFHNLMLEEYLAVMDNPGNALNKMKQFWIWFCHSFKDQKKCLKRIEKSKTMNDFKQAVRVNFSENIS